MQQASAMEEIRNNQLPGVRFCPMEDELLLFYLKPMLSGQNVPGRNSVVFDCDLYGQQEPWEIWEAYKTKRPNDLRLNKDLYFFTQHKKMKSTDKRIRRTVGSGTWKGNDSGKPVKSSGHKIGLKKRFTYANEKSKHHGCWILHEFYLDRSLRDKKAKVKDYVLCLLRKNGDSKTKTEKKRKQREEEYVLDAGDDGEQSNTEQEELLETQAKRQRTVCAPLSEVDAFIAQLEGSMECVQDDFSCPSEAEAIGFQGVEDGVCAPPVPTPSEVDAFIAQLEGSMECVQDDNSPPSEAEAIGFQGVEDGVCAPPVPTPSEVDAFIAQLEGSMECVQDDFSCPSEAEAIGFQGVEDGVCAPPVPTPSEVDAFIAQLEGSMECVQDDFACPSEAEAIGFQGVEDGVCAPPVPTPSEVDAFIAQLEGSMECVQDDNSPPSEAEAIGFQGVEDGGLQQLALEVQSGPSFVPLPEEDFVMEQCFEELRNYEEREEQDPAGSNNVCGGLIDHNGDDWINSISFSPEDNDLFSSEMLSSLLADIGLPCSSLCSEG